VSPNTRDSGRRAAEFLISSESLCSRCGGTVPWPDGFAIDKSKTFGRKSWCKKCESRKSIAYYWANRERILDERAAKRGGKRAVARETCSECGIELEGRQQLTCGSRSCRDKRFKRTNSEGYAKREAGKVARRRERRRQLRGREILPAAVKDGSAEEKPGDES
jgi:hypothetical protein